MNNNELLISVIVPIYNVEKYLCQCVDSVLSQTYKKIELLLVDDGSTDKSGIICDEYANRDKRVIVIHKENSGLSDARNKGIEKCKGDYLIFVDSDDFWTNEFVLEKLVEKAKNSDIVYFGYARCYDNDIVPDTFINSLNDSYENGICFLNDVLSKSHAFSWYSWLYLMKSGIWKNKISFPKGKIYEDVQTTYKQFVNAKRISILKDICYCYRIRNNSITKNEQNISPYLDACINTRNEVNNNKKIPLNTKKLINNCLLLNMMNVAVSIANIENRDKRKQIEKNFVNYVKQMNDAMSIKTKLMRAVIIMFKTKFFSKIILIKEKATQN